MTLNVDFAPTILGFANVTAPKEMQGRSLVPLLTNVPPADWRKEFFYEHHFAPAIIPPSEGIRTESWSYIRWLPPNPELEELYDLSTDPLEGENVAADPGHADTLLTGTM
jgi:arylsulfatase A-like enzyme